MESITGLTLCFKARAAVHRTITTGLEGHLSGTSATVTDYFIHLAGSIAIAILSTARSTACRAAAGLILESFFSEKGLFTGRENEFVATVTANQSLVFVHCRKPP